MSKSVARPITPFGTRKACFRGKVQPPASEPITTSSGSVLCVPCQRLLVGCATLWLTPCADGVPALTTYGWHETGTNDENGELWPSNNLRCGRLHLASEARLSCPEW